MHINSLGTMDSVLQTGMSAGFVLVSLGSSPSLTNIGFWSPDLHADIYRRPGGANTRVDTLTPSKLMPTVSRNPRVPTPKRGQTRLRVCRSGACRPLSVDAHDKGTRQGPAHTGPCTPRLAAGPARRTQATVSRYGPRPAARAAPTLRPLLSRLPGVHHTEAAHMGPGKAAEREMAGRGGAERGAPSLRYGRGAPVPAQARGRHAPSLRAGARVGRALLCAGALRGARSRVPRGALGHKGLQGKRGARARVCGADSGRERPGADSRRGSRARRNRELGPSLRSLPFLSFPRLSPV